LLPGKLQLDDGGVRGISCRLSDMPRRLTFAAIPGQRRVMRGNSVAAPHTRPQVIDGAGVDLVAYALHVYIGGDPDAPLQV
jgi:hypothetical protein